MDLSLSQAADPALLMLDSGYDPDPWQAAVMRSYSPRIMILCARQMGKSLTTACKAIHRALYHDGSLVLLVSRSQDQADELYAKIIKVYNILDRPVRAVRELASEIILENTSRIVALPNNPDTVRGYSDVDLLIVDEASRVPHALIVAVLPMIMASRGDVILLSTPAGRSNYFYEQWTDPVGRWEKIAALAADCPRFSPDEIAELRRELGPVAAAQELDCEFLMDGAQVFLTESVENAFTSNRSALSW